MSENNSFLGAAEVIENVKVLGWCARYKEMKNVLRFISLLQMEKRGTRVMIAGME